MAENNKYPERKKTILDHSKVKLRIKNEADKWASLTWGVFASCPRITVYTGMPQDPDKGRITAPMDMTAFGSLVQLLKQAIAFVPTDTKPEFKEIIVNRRPTDKYRGVGTEGLVTVSRTYVGKDKEGVVYLSVVDKKSSIVKFPIVLADFHEFIHGDGSPYTRGESSCLAAAGYIDLINDVVKNIIEQEYVEEEWKTKGDKSRQNGGGYNSGSNGGGNGGGGYGGNNGGGGSSSDSFNDDIPFCHDVDLDWRAGTVAH